MNKREAERLTRQNDTLMALGFTQAEAEQLRRISMTLQRWHERECGTDGGCIERDDVTGKAYWLSSHSGRRSPIADRETGAKRRLAAIIAARNGHREYCTMLAPIPRGSIAEHAPCDCGKPSRPPVSAYIQTDPRGAALYIIRPGDVPEGGNVDAYYSRGICVY